MAELPSKFRMNGPFEALARSFQSFVDIVIDRLRQLDGKGFFNSEFPKVEYKTITAAEAEFDELVVDTKTSPSAIKGVIIIAAQATASTSEDAAMQSFHWTPHPRGFRIEAVNFVGSSVEVTVTFMVIS